MAAGSDYGGLAQGQIGQGIAQGVQQGTDNYNKGVDRKAAQANTYLTNFIGPNLARLGRPEPRPDADAPPAEHQAWARREAARINQLNTLLKQSQSYLKDTGSPLSEQEWAGLWYDPTSITDPQELAAIGANASTLTRINEQRNQHLQRLASITDVTSPAYAQALKEYNTFLTDSNYGAVYKSATGVDYREVVGTPEFIQASQKAKVKSADEQWLLAMSRSSNPDIASMATQMLQNPNFDLDVKVGDTGKSARSILQGLIKNEQLDEMITSGKAEDYATAIATLDNMAATDPERFAALPASVKTFYTQVQAYRQGDTSKPISEPLKDALTKYKLTTNALTQSGLNIATSEQGLQLGAQRLRIGEQEYDLNEQRIDLTFGEAARDGNRAVLGMKDQFMAGLPEGTTPEEAEKLWTDTVIKPLGDYQAKSDLAMKNSAENLLTMQGENLDREINRATKDGTFHLLMGTFVQNADGSERFVIDKNTQQYKNFVKQFGSEELADAKIAAWAGQSRDVFNDLGTMRQNQAKMSAQNLRIATANAQTAEVEAKYADAFATTDLANKQYITAQNKVQAQIAPAKARGELRQLMYEGVKQFGVGILDDPAFRADFEAALGGPEAFNAAKSYLTAREKYERSVEKNQLTIQGQQIKAADADEFDRMFKSPQAIEMYLSDPNKVAELAKRIGVDPQHALAALRQLRSENRTLNSLQVKSMRFDMYMRQQNLDLAVRSQNFSEYNANREFNRGVFVSDRAFTEGQYIDRRDFEYRQDRDEVADGFTMSGLNLQYAQFDDMRTFRNQQYNDDVARDARDYALRVRAQGASEADSVRQFQAMFLQPLASKIDIVQGQLGDATDTVNKLLEDKELAAWNNGGIKWEKDKNGLWVASGPVDPSKQQAYDRMKPRIDQLTSAKNIVENLTVELNEGKTLYTQIVTDAQRTLGGGVENIPDNTKPYQGSVTDPKKGTQNYKAYAQSAPTTGAAALATSVQKAINGQFAGTPYANMYTEGYCTTFIQAVMNDTMNVPGGVPKGGSRGALGFKDGLLAKGATQYPGSGPNSTLTQADIKNLPDGTLIVQDDGTTQGHIGMVLGGVIVQSSQYKDNKVRGAIGTMSVSSYVGAKNLKGQAVKNYAIIVPNDWYKNGNGTRNNNSGGGGTTTGAGSRTPAAAPAKPATGRYVNPDNTFKADMPAIGQLVGRYEQKGGAGVRMVSSPGGKSGLSLKTGDNRYAYITNDAVAQQAVGAFVVQFGSYVKTAIPGGSIDAMFKADRTKARQSLITALSNAGFSGDIEKYVDKLIKAKKW